MADDNFIPPSLYTLDEEGNRLWVYPQRIWGVFTRNRSVVAYSLLILYLLLPWLHMRGLPFIQFNILERQFIIAGNIYWPQDVKYLVFILIGAGVALFLFTSVAGRVWCGWACPQTVFIEHVYRRIERWIEGAALARRQLEAGPWTSEKIAKRVSKHFLYLLFSIAIAHLFLSYFISTSRIPHLGRKISN